jgi:hypothetical protein
VQHFELGVAAAIRLFYSSHSSSELAFCWRAREKSRRMVAATGSFQTAADIRPTARDNFIGNWVKIKSPRSDKPLLRHSLCLLKQDGQI